MLGPGAVGEDRYLMFFTDFNSALGQRDCRYVLMDLEGRELAQTERTGLVARFVAGGLLHATLEHDDGEVDVATFQVGS